MVSALTRVAAAVTIGLWLGGCSFLLDADWGSSPADPAPDTADVSALYGKIGGIFTSLKLSGSPEISAVRRAEAVSVANWVICLRNNAPDNVRYYAVYVKKNEVVDYRLAVLMDRCEQESFTPLQPK